jgi:hypothetical protein
MNLSSSNPEGRPLGSRQVNDISINHLSIGLSHSYTELTVDYSHSGRSDQSMKLIHSSSSARPLFRERLWQSGSALVFRQTSYNLHHSHVLLSQRSVFLLFRRCLSCLDGHRTSVWVRNMKGRNITFLWSY